MKEVDEVKEPSGDLEVAEAGSDWIKDERLHAAKLCRLLGLANGARERLQLAWGGTGSGTDSIHKNKNIRDV